MSSRNELFTHDGKEYEVRVTSNGNKTIVRAFLEGKPANGYEHSVEAPVAIGFTYKFGYDPVTELVATAKEEVVNESWDRYLEAVKKHDSKQSEEATITQYIDGTPENDNLDAQMLVAMDREK